MLAGINLSSRGLQGTEQRGSRGLPDTDGDWLSCSLSAPWGVHARLEVGICSRCGWLSHHAQAQPALSAKAAMT